MENIRVFYLKTFQFLEMKFPIYLYRSALVMAQQRFKSACTFAFWIANDAKLLQADNEDSNQTALMDRLT